MSAPAAAAQPIPQTLPVVLRASPGATRLCLLAADLTAVLLAPRLGAGKTARLLIEDLRARPEIGLKPVACLDDDPGKLGECAGVPVPGPLSLAPELARSLKVRHAIVAMPGVSGPRLVSILERWGAS